MAIREAQEREGLAPGSSLSLFVYSNKTYDLVGQYLSSLCYKIGISMGIHESQELSRFTLCPDQTDQGNGKQICK